MPSYDSSRARFRLADRHIAVFAHLLDGETPPEELWESLVELQRLGLVGEEGELAPVLRDLLGALADPVVLIQVEVTGEHGPVNHGVVVGQDAVISHDGWPGEEESEYVSIEPNTLVWDLARKVNLHRGEKPEEGAPEVRVATTMRALDAAFVALEEPGADDDATRALVRDAVTAADPDLEGTALDLFRDLVVSLNATWRVTTAWDGRHDGRTSTMIRALAVWDCGPLGYWLREQPEEPITAGQVGPDSPLVLRGSDSGEVWEKLTDLLPDREELNVADTA
ncbi:MULTISPECIES: hypothetical protein [Streptomyces]|uniref:ESX secretion-associated protein EspG n=1 Tax=Streptomyces doudnae TaxID=3075536 RepID=A0ABD5EX06_9ACTN|nr:MULTISPECIES: hypothetical protein [unclassified Streptomyces]MDT0439286.1 hypothetical protein [Streptomyces sp. DSM 41981]MYQ63457.1 hypothetical protein [Streptomyces sp. SID4950]SCD58557.1 hypothetical protein GA0115242_109422 [Streptomyces sp. SolWspMP-5a-2]